jgi:hypothetical protein
LVTVRDLKISLSLRDANFKKEMKAVNRAAGSFGNNLKRSDENLQTLQKTLNTFNGANIPNQIKIEVDQPKLQIELAKVIADFNKSGHVVTLDVSHATLKKSVEEFVANLGGGQFIKHLPLKLLESSLKDSINAFLEKAGKGAGFGGNQAGIKPLPLKIDVPFLVASINKFLEQAMKGKTDIGKEDKKKGKKKSSDDTEEKPGESKDPIKMMIDILKTLATTQKEANKLLSDIKAKTGEAAISIG